MIRCFWLGLASLTILTSCVTTQTESLVPQNQVVAWDARAQTLTKISRWDLNGMIAIRNPQDNITASLHWQQSAKDYSLYLFGPMGTNGFKLTGTQHQVALQNPRGQVFYASSPEALLAQQTGWKLPVSNLYYWIRGLPVPGMAAHKQLDAYNHLMQLHQDGWDIEYLRYTASRHIDLPTKIFLHTKDLSVKIIISQWQLP